MCIYDHTRTLQNCTAAVDIISLLFLSCRTILFSFKPEFTNVMTTSFYKFPPLLGVYNLPTDYLHQLNMFKSILYLKSLHDFLFNFYHFPVSAINSSQVLQHVYLSAHISSFATVPDLSPTPPPELHSPGCLSIGSVDLHKEGFADRETCLPRVIQDLSSCSSNPPSSR